MWPPGRPNGAPRRRRPTHGSSSALLLAGLLAAAAFGAACHRAVRSRTPGPAPGPEERPAFDLRLGDPAYLSRPGPAQELPVTRRIHRIAHPTFGAPALALPGGLLAVDLAARTPSERAAAARAVLHLETRVLGEEVRLALVVVRAELASAKAPPTSATSATSAALADGASVLVRLFARVPAEAPPETFDLVAVVPGAPTARQPRAVRILDEDPATRPFRIALVSDQQLWDPSVLVSSGRLNARAYPTRGERQENRAIARQVLHELGLWDPAFAVGLGDVVFGLDYEKELEDALAMLSESAVATFLVPGNHDAYARYGVDLKLGLAGLAAAAIRCRHLVLPRREGWTADRVFRLIGCVYGDVKDKLFRRLLYDGLVAWRRNVGPPYYRFDLGRYRFIALNTYDGTAARRHAYSLWVDFRGLHLGAPLVDNYGGYLSEAQLRFVEAEAKAGVQEGRTVVFLGHHDPRGNAEGQRFHENEPFPTSPVGIGHFEEWNYDGAWDSDPTDRRGRERPEAHSGHALLRIVARYGSAYLSGHVHRDEQRTYRAGEALLGTIRAARDLTFLRVTSASASTSKDGKWGYRILTAHPDGRLELAPFQSSPPRWSVPAGNLWAAGDGALVVGAPPLPGRPGDGTALGAVGAGLAASGIALYSGLPRPVEVTVRALLPLAASGTPGTASASGASGYRFSARAPARIRLADVFPLPASPGRPARALHYLRLTVPAAGSDVVTHAAGVQMTDVRVSPATGNRAPEPVVRVAGRPLAAGASLSLANGDGLTLDASASRDPDGDAILAPLWQVRDLGNGAPTRGGRGPRLALRPERPGRYAVNLTLRDARGAAAAWRAEIVAR